MREETNEAMSPKGKAAQEFGRMYVDALVQNAKLPAEPGYFTVRQEDLANIAAAAFEIGAQWRQHVSGVTEAPAMDLSDVAPHRIAEALSDMSDAAAGVLGTFNEQEKRDA